MFYLHIPKTGGQTLARRLASAFPPGRAHLRSDQFTYPQDLAALAAALAGHDFVEAHVTGEMLSEGAPADLLVTLREPVAQIASNYRHIRREPDRRLSRAARELAPAAFFDHFGDFFTDFQARYLLSAFLPLHIAEQRDGFWPTAARHLPAILQRIRWLVPTERIDAFLPLWEAETGRRAAEPAYTTNHAPDDGVDLPALEVAIRARPALFALDNALYHNACTRYAEWAAAVEEQARPWDCPANASRVFHRASHHGEASGIWLRRGWLPSEDTPHGPGNWAGPTTRCDVTLRRAPGEDWLTFDCLVVNGITFADVNAYETPGFAELPVERAELAPDRWHYRIALHSLPSACTIALMVPDCYAAINVVPSGEAADLERRSFLAANWALEAG